MVEVKLSEDKKKVIITADLETPTPSGSGKTLVVASSRGIMKTSVVEPTTGKTLQVGLNVFVAK